MHRPDKYPEAIGRAALLALLLILAFFPSVSPAGAQTPQAKVLAFGESMSGLTLVEEVILDGLAAGGERVLPIELAKGQAYTIVGYCDQSCGNLDLVLLDPSGSEVVSDLLPDAQPLLTLTTEVRGTFELKVLMVSCDAEPCIYALGAYAGGEGGVVDADVDTYRGQLEAQGFSDLGQVGRGSLEEGHEARFPVSLRAGLDYRLLGVCDKDCADLDLLLLDAEGREVDSDVMADANPMVAVSTSSESEYQLRVLMVSCGIQPCGFSVMSFARERDLGEVPFSGTLVLDRTYSGALETTDPALEEGQLYDVYTVSASQGQTIVVDLRSEEFDTYLIVAAPGGKLERNDDYAGETARSHLELLAPSDGSYSILVTSFGADQTGAYLLRVTVMEGGRQPHG